MTAKLIHGEEANAVEVTQYDVHTPAVYRDGVFYNVKETPEKRELVTAERIPTEAENIAKLNATVTELQSANEELMVFISNLVGGGENA